MPRSPRPPAPPVTPSTLAEIAAELGRDRLYLLGRIKPFELPPGHGNRFPAIYLSLFRTVVFLRLAQIPEEKLVELWILEKKLMNLLHVDTSGSPTWMNDGHSAVFLDLGQVAVMAEVNLNGKDLGILWKPPFRVEITDSVKAGENTLELKVVNLWINRQIGAEHMPEDSDRDSTNFLRSWPAWLTEGKPSPTSCYTIACGRRPKLWQNQHRSGR